MFAGVRNDDDRPGGTDGHPDDRGGGHGGSGGLQAPSGPAGTHSLGTQSYNYYDDDDGYSEAEATSLAGTGSGYVDDLAPVRRPMAWTAGADLGLLVLRLALGAIFLLHGAQKMFGAFGGPDTEAFAQVLAQMGFRESGTLALITGGTELAAGALLVFGLFTPLAAAGVVAVMANAVFLNIGNGLFLPDGVEYEAMLGALGLGLMFTGPGRVALDKGRVWFRRPLLFGFLALLIAGGAAGVVLGLYHQP